MTETTVVEIKGGVAEVTHGGHDAIVIDWDSQPMDYEDAYNTISEVLGSSLDGPEQMRLTRSIADKFLNDLPPDR